MGKSAEPNGIFASADMHYSADSMVNSVLPLLSKHPESNTLQMLSPPFRQITLQLLITVLSHYILIIRMVTLFYVGVAQIFISDPFTNYVLE